MIHGLRPLLPSSEQVNETHVFHAASERVQNGTLLSSGCYTAHFGHGILGHRNTAVVGKGMLNGTFVDACDVLLHTRRIDPTAGGLNPAMVTTRLRIEEGRLSMSRRWFVTEGRKKGPSRRA
jgi:hypothetical protein